MRRSIAVIAGSIAAVVAVTALPAMAARHVTTSPSFSKHSYVVKSGKYVTVRVYTHLHVNSPVESCHLTVSGPGGSGFSTHKDLSGDFDITLSTRGARAGRWRLSESCHAARLGRSRVTRATVLVKGGHGRRMLGSPLYTLEQPPLSVGDGGVGVPPPDFQNGECTYWAYMQRPDIYLTSVANGAPTSATLQGAWDAKNWAKWAQQYGHFAVGTTPVAGAIMVEPGRPGNPDGHVAFVKSVTDSSHFVTTEMNTDGNATPGKWFTVDDSTAPNPDPSGDPSGTYVVDGQQHRYILPGTVFIYGGPVINPPQYADELGHIVQWSGDTKAQKTAWLVVDQGGQLHRHWIPTIAVYWCLKNAGDQGPDVLSSTELNAIPDDTGVQATCTGNSTPPGQDGGNGGGGGPTETTYSEQQGHNGANTFTDPPTATGTGQRIAPAEQVQVSCKVYAPQIASVNPDGYWYRIASPPWNDEYYAPANTFMNGDLWDGPYTHNTDFTVPDCPGSGGGTTTTTTTTTQTTTTPTSQTWPETAGSVVHTWTNYTNAGGTEGPDIADDETVQIACKTPGFQVADGNTWWYRIAQAPWSGTYYASADAFYNNGATSGSLLGTPFFDPNVANC